MPTDDETLRIKLTNRPASADLRGTERSLAIAVRVDDLAGPNPIERARVGEILAHFAGRLPTALGRIDAAVEAADDVALEQAAHRLKGSSATLGADDLARLCAELEEAAQQADRAVVAEVLTRLRTEAATTATAMVGMSRHLVATS